MNGKLQNNPQRLTELRAKIDAVDEIHSSLANAAGQRHRRAYQGKGRCNKKRAPRSGRDERPA